MRSTTPNEAFGEVGYNLIMNPITHLKDTWAELKQVRWPTRKQTLTLSGIVVGVSILMAAYVGSLDYGFTNLLKLLLK